MVDLKAFLLIILTALYWLKKNKDLIVWQKKLEEYQKIAKALDYIYARNYAKTRLLDYKLKWERNREVECLKEDYDKALKDLKRAEKKYPKGLIILKRSIDIGALIIPENILGIIRLFSSEFLDIDRILKSRIRREDNPKVQKDASVFLFDSKELIYRFLNEAQTDLETFQQSFSRSVRNIWRDIKLFCR